VQNLNVCLADVPDDGSLSVTRHLACQPSTPSSFS